MYFYVSNAPTGCWFWQLRRPDHRPLASSMACYTARDDCLASLLELRAVTGPVLIYQR